ncbi:hypothetical protein M569_13534, partial [Genlisea aurea]
LSARPSSSSPHRLDLNSAAAAPAPPLQEQRRTPSPDSIFGKASPPKRGSFKHGDSTYRSLIESTAEVVGSIAALETIFREMKLHGRSFTESNFILFFRACGKARSPHKAMEFFHRMTAEFHCRQTVKSFNSVLNVVIQQGLYREALEFHDRIIHSKKNNVSPNGLTFNLLIKACCRSGLVDRALHVFRDMATSNCDPDAYTYSTLMDGLCKADRLDDAMALLDEMHVEGCFPAAETFNVLINGLCRKGDLSRAAKLVDNMFLKGCIPTVVTYNTLIHGLCNRGKVEKAVDLVSRMISDNLAPSEVTYGTLITGLVRRGRASEGVRLLTLMEERGLKPNEYAFSSLISGLFKENNPEEALKLWERMTKTGRKPNTVLYGALIDGLCRERRPHDAEGYLVQMIEDGCKPNSFVYASLMRGFFEAGDGEKAIALWQQLDRETADSNNNSVFFFSIMINGLCKEGRLTDATMLWKSMLVKGLSLDTVAYSSMVHGFCNAGLVNQGLNLLDEMLSSSDARPDAVTYTILIGALCRRGEIHRAVELLDTMLSQGCDPDPTCCRVFLREGGVEPERVGEFLEELASRLLNRDRASGA